MPRYRFVTAFLDMTKADIEELLNYAIQKLKANDSELLDLGVSERALMFHLGRYICEKVPPDLSVDCEYNRQLKDKKQLLYLKRELELEQEHDVFPDILIHQRNSHDRNVLVLEIKKYREELGTDIRKLKAFKAPPYEYDFAVQMVIGKPDSLTDIAYEFV